MLSRHGSSGLAPSQRAGAQPAADENVRDPAGKAEQDAHPHLSGEIAEQEVKLLEAAALKRELKTEGHGGESDAETEQPPLPGQELVGAAQGAQLKIGRKRGRHCGGQVFREL